MLNDWEAAAILLGIGAAARIGYGLVTSPFKKKFEQDPRAGEIPTLPHESLSQFPDIEKDGAAFQQMMGRADRPVELKDEDFVDLGATLRDDPHPVSQAMADLVDVLEEKKIDPRQEWLDEVKRLTSNPSGEVTDFFQLPLTFNGQSNTVCIRILPPMREDAPEPLFVERAWHTLNYPFGKFLCTGQTCPACKAAKELDDKGESEKARTFRSFKRYYYNIYDPSTGNVSVLGAPTGMHREIVKAVKDLGEEPTDLHDGHDMFLTRGSCGHYPFYTVRFCLERSKLAEDADAAAEILSARSDLHKIGNTAKVITNEMVLNQAEKDNIKLACLKPKQPLTLENLIANNVGGLYEGLPPEERLRKVNELRHQIIRDNQLVIAAVNSPNFGIVPADEKAADEKAADEKAAEATVPQPKYSKGEIVYWKTKTSNKKSPTPSPITGISRSVAPNTAWDYQLHWFQGAKKIVFWIEEDKIIEIAGEDGVIDYKRAEQQHLSSQKMTT